MFDFEEYRNLKFNRHNLMWASLKHFSCESLNKSLSFPTFSSKLHMLERKLSQLSSNNFKKFLLLTITNSYWLTLKFSQMKVQQILWPNKGWLYCSDLGNNTLIKIWTELNNSLLEFSTDLWSWLPKLNN